MSKGLNPDQDTHSADNLCKQFGSGSGLTGCPS